MIKPLVQYLRLALLNTGYFQKVFELCVQVNKGGLAFPVHYITKDTIEDVSIFDQVIGMAYFRKIGDTQKEPFTGLKTIPCGANSVSTYTYDLKIVGCVPKDKATCNDAYSDDEICSVITSIIDNPSGIRSELQAQAVSVLTTSFSTDSAKIFKDEYPGKKKEDFDYNYAYFSLDVTAKITISQACFIQNCYNGQAN